MKKTRLRRSSQWGRNEPKEAGRCLGATQTVSRGGEYLSRSDIADRPSEVGTAKWRLEFGPWESSAGVEREGSKPVGSELRREWVEKKLH